MKLLYMIILGIVQGVTEFLPVSSFGHVSALNRLFGIEFSNMTFCGVMLHMGTLVALIVALRDDIKKILAETFYILEDIWYNLHQFLKKDMRKDYRRILSNNYRRLAAFVWIGTIPTGLLGILSTHIVAAATADLTSVGIGFLITGILLLVVDLTKGGNKIPRNASGANAMWIGICQGISVLPGVSRLGMVLSASLLCGFTRKFAIRYSFLLSIPAISGALIWELIHIGDSGVTPGDFGLCFVGAVFAGITGFFAIHYMIHVLKRCKFKHFAIYCFLIGILSIVGNYLY